MLLWWFERCSTSRAKQKVMQTSVTPSCAKSEMGVPSRAPSELMNKEEKPVTIF